LANVHKKNKSSFCGYGPGVRAGGGKFDPLADALTGRRCRKRKIEVAQYKEKKGKIHSRGKRGNSGRGDSVKTEAIAAAKEALNYGKTSPEKSLTNSAAGGKKLRPHTGIALELADEVPLR